MGCSCFEAKSIRGNGRGSTLVREFGRISQKSLLGIKCPTAIFDLRARYQSTRPGIYLGFPQERANTANGFIITDGPLPAYWLILTEMLSSLFSLLTTLAVGNLRNKRKGCPFVSTAIFTKIEWARIDKTFVKSRR